MMAALDACGALFRPLNDSARSHSKNKQPTGGAPLLVPPPLLASRSTNPWRETRKKNLSLLLEHNVQNAGACCDAR
jgi:hypothetical protein